MPSSRPCPWGLPGRPSRARGQLVHVHTASISCWWSSSASRWSSLYSRLLSWLHTYPVVFFKCSIVLLILLSHVVEGGIAHMPRWGISSLRPVKRISISIKTNSTLVAAIAIVTVIFRLVTRITIMCVCLSSCMRFSDVTFSVCISVLRPMVGDIFASKSRPSVETIIAT